MAARLSSEGLIPSGYVVTEGFLPATPDKVVALRESRGAGANEFFGGAPIEEPVLQVLTRGAKLVYTDARAAIEDIYQASFGWGAFTSAGTRYLKLTPLQPPFPLDKDGNERYVFAVNFLVQKELSS